MASETRSTTLSINSKMETCKVPSSIGFCRVWVLRAKFNTKNAYRQEEIDEIRTKWAAFVSRFVCWMIVFAVILYGSVEKCAGILVLALMHCILVCIASELDIRSHVSYSRSCIKYSMPWLDWIEVVIVAAMKVSKLLNQGTWSILASMVDTRKAEVFLTSEPMVRDLITLQVIMAF
ncbi:gag protease polyprotein [Cucumis melo var. makuwa]|uniref:Gag protease polyprotein n=1 Tax=Cucumis melo var. makuwa TaxID=1194695 RepID=A0A5D3C8X3_CUCMM|nr:gag protease polyprotein [Cucumis melo var. makuwa]